MIKLLQALYGFHDLLCSARSVKYDVMSSPASGHYYNVAPKAGRNLMVPLDNTVVNKVLRPKKMRYEPTKFTWLGSSNQTNAVIVIRSDKGINNILDMRKIPAIGSTSGKNSRT